MSQIVHDEGGEAEGERVQGRPADDVVGGDPSQNDRPHALAREGEIQPGGPLEVNSIALLKSQQTFQQSFYSSVGPPVVLETLSKSLLLKSVEISTKLLNCAPGRRCRHCRRRGSSCQNSDWCPLTACRRQAKTGTKD